MHKMIPRFELDKDAWYGVIRWIVKWGIVMSVLMLFWNYVFQAQTAAEARLQHIEHRLDSLERQ